MCSWFLESREVYSSFILVQLISCTIALGISILYLDLVYQIKNENFNQIDKVFISFQQFHQIDSSVAIILLGASSALSNLFIYCCFGEWATRNYDQMSECLYYDSNWFNLPNKLQKYLVLMIANMQKPMYYHGFEVAIMDLQTFILVKFIHETIN